MRKLSTKGQFVASIMLIVFVGILVSASMLSFKAGRDEAANSGVIQEAIQVNNISISPVQDVPIAPVDDEVKTISKMEPIKEIIVCKVINGVKHFSNEFIG